MRQSCAMRAVCAVLAGGGLAANAGAQPSGYDRFDMRYRFETELTKKPGLFVETWIESALQFVGNLNLAEDPKDEVDLAGIEVRPGIYTSYLSPRAQGFLDYNLIGRVWEDSDYNEISHRLAAQGQYAVIPEWFRIEGAASYTDVVLDPSRSYNYGGSGLFYNDNLSERATASLSPVVSHDFADFRFDARYTYGRVWYLDKPDRPGRPIFSIYQDDSIDQQALVSFSKREQRDAFSGRIYYEWQESEFETTVPYRFERAGAEVGFRLTRTLSLVADGGVESDLDQSTTKGGLDSEFWHAGLEWRPDERTVVDARYGERFFGESWKLSVSRETRYLTMRLSYVEDPQVETRRIGINFDPDDLPLPDPGLDLSGFTSFPYVGKDATATFLSEGARTKLRLDVYDRKREYIQDFPPDEETQGVRFNALRDFGAYLYGEFDTRYDDVVSGRRNPDIGSGDLVYHYYDWNVIGRVNWEVYTNFRATAEAGYLNRSGSTDYDGQWVAFRFRYTF
jgi:hypothetical protein